MSRFTALIILVVAATCGLAYLITRPTDCATFVRNFEESNLTFASQPSRERYAACRRNES